MNIKTNLKNIIHHIDDLIFILNPDGVFLEFHQQSNKHLYMSADNFQGKNCREVLPRHVWKPFVKATEQIKKTKSADHFEYTLMTPSGLLWFEAKVTGIFDKKGKLKHLIVVVRESTKRKISEKYLKERINTIKAMSDYLIMQEEIISQLRSKNEKTK
ncbi:MAG: PAS domain-containing protein [Parcubacteria group bacterium]|nr:PAS domain-containing protein [Parcubacteria group bacterium]